MKRRRGQTPKRKSAKKRELGRYKSGLEKTCADLLAESGIPFSYEEHEYTLMDKFRYDGVYWKMTSKKKDMTDRSNSVALPIRYKPDFVAKDESWIIETKGFLHSHHDFPMRWKLFMKYLTELGKPLPMLFICKNRQQVEQAISIIKDNIPNDKGRRGKKLRRSNRKDAPPDSELLRGPIQQGGGPEETPRVRSGADSESETAD